MVFQVNQHTKEKYCFTAVFSRVLHIEIFNICMLFCHHFFSKMKNVGIFKQTVKRIHLYK